MTADELLERLLLRATRARQSARTIAPKSTSEVAAMRQRLRRQEAELEAKERRFARAAVAPDDSGYKPTSVDPLLKGACRQVGVAAKAVKRKTAITLYDYENAQ